MFSRDSSAFVSIVPSPCKQRPIYRREYTSQQPHLQALHERKTFLPLSTGELPQNGVQVVCKRAAPPTRAGEARTS